MTPAENATVDELDAVLADNHDPLGELLRAWRTSVDSAAVVA